MFFQGAHQFWASVAKGVGGWEAEGGGWGERWQKLVKSVQSSSRVKTRSPEQSIVGYETQWTQPWPRVRSQADVIHLVLSTGAIVSNPHLHSVESCPEKSRPIKHGGQLHGLMIAIEYSYKLDRKNYFNLWCELGWLLLRQSHMLGACYCRLLQPVHAKISFFNS